MISQAHRICSNIAPLIKDYCWHILADAIYSKNISRLRDQTAKHLTFSDFEQRINKQNVDAIVINVDPAQVSAGLQSAKDAGI